MSSIRIPGKILYAGYDWTTRITFESDAVSFPSTATFVAHVRRAPEVEEILATLTTANGGIVRIDTKTLEITIPGAATEGWPANRKAYVDIVRDDQDPPEHLGFRLIIPVQIPITRL